MRSILQILIVLILFITGLLFNVGLIDIRFEEVNYQLGKVASIADDSRSLGILSKYELIKRRMELGESDKENYEMEARVQALISGDQLSGDMQDDVTKRKKYLIPVRILLNAIRLVLGKELIKPEQENEIFKVLEIGYFWERNRKYKEAIDIYDKVLDMPAVDEDIRATVLLHKGFCFSMLSEYEKSIDVYERVINVYPDTDAGKTAWKLLDFISSINQKRVALSKRDVSGFEKAKQYYLLMDYRNAIKFFSEYLENSPKSSTAYEAGFLKGRAHEELGETEEAVFEYRKTIKKDRSKRWAREANRRMLMLGEFYAHKRQMAQEAKKQLAAYKDKGFMDQVDKFKGMMAESSIRDELLKKQRMSSGEISSADNGEVLDLLNSIGDMDLTGESQRQKEQEKLRRELIRKGAGSEAEIRALERKSLLASNPFRRPSVIKEVIDGNVNQLRYIYNKKLRMGTKISGRVIIKLDIKPNGSISNTQVVSSSVANEDFEKEITDKIRSWKFRAVPDSLGTLSIKYPFEFFEE